MVYVCQDELFDLFNSIGYGLSNEEFDLLYERASGSQGEGYNNNTKCSIAAFRKTWNDYITAKEYDTLDQFMEGRQAAATK